MNDKQFAAAQAAQKLVLIAIALMFGFAVSSTSPKDGKLKRQPWPHPCRLEKRPRRHAEQEGWRCHA
ncbi:hypothetical protein UU5_05568 [Rhodanobacter sp. 115]|nr:hypothetical protein UU5_05568 [Rhodanobacter sp. 115]